MNIDLKKIPIKLPILKIDGEEIKILGLFKIKYKKKFLKKP